MIFVLVFLAYVGMPLLFAETFFIHGGGTIEGKILVPGERPIRIETSDGIILSIDPQLIEEKVRDEGINRKLYNQSAPLLPDTVENHLKIADWCKERFLKDLEAIHLERILEFEPDHAEARRRLGYFRDKKSGEWTTTEELQSAKGYVHYKGTWRPPQEVWILEQTEQQKGERKDWKREIRQLRSAVGNTPTNSSSPARRKLEQLADPGAVPAIIDALKKEKDPDMRLIYVRALSNIGTQDAVREIAYMVMYDPLETVQDICLDQIKRHSDAVPLAGAYFSTFLLNTASDGTAYNDPATINKAAYAIGEIKDRSSIGNLIRALTTKHKETITIGSGDQTNVGFGGTGGTGFGQGQSKREIIHTNNNADVLNALRRLTGKDFQYDKAAWNRWFMEKRKPVPFNARRG